MPAGHAQRIACPDDPRPYHPATVDRLLQTDVVPVLRPDIAHRGESGIKHGPAVADCCHGKEAVGIFQTAPAADVGWAIEVDVHVDQPGQQSLVAHVDMFDVGPPLDRAGIGDPGDPSVRANEDRRMLDIFAGRDIELTRRCNHSLFGCRVF